MGLQDLNNFVLFEVSSGDVELAYVFGLNRLLPLDFEVEFHVLMFLCNITTSAFLVILTFDRLGAHLFASSLQFGN